jgi:chromosomal replication initiator protein
MDGRRIALASDEHPSRVQKLSRELVSRFVAGMVVKLERPDEATRREIARSVAARRGMTLDGPSLAALAARCVESVREIEGAVTRIQAMRMLHGGAPGEGVVEAALVRQALGVDAPLRPARPVRVQAIVQVVCESLEVSQSELLGPGRQKRVVLARALIGALARRLTNCSFPEIARAMGRAHHSSIVTACQRLERQMERGERCGLADHPGSGGADPTISDLLERLSRQLCRPSEAA